MKTVPRGKQDIKNIKQGFARPIFSLNIPMEFPSFDNTGRDLFICRAPPQGNQPFIYHRRSDKNLVQR